MVAALYLQVVLKALIVVTLVAGVGCGSTAVPSDDVTLDVTADAVSDVAVDTATDSALPPDADVATDSLPPDTDVAADVSPSDESTGDTDTSTPPNPAFRVFDMSDAGNINGMWGNANTSVWAVGDNGLVLVLRNGEFVSGPIPPVRKNFFAIAGRDDTIYVVGQDGIALRFRDGVWADLHSPVDKDLLAISCPARDECYAVGRAGTIVHYLDGVWDEQNSGVVYDLLGVLSEVNGGTWAVGAYGSLFELSGTVWISSQIAGTLSWMRDIYRAPDGAMFAVGNLGTIVMKKAGSIRWEQQLSDDSSEPARDLYSVTGTSSSDVWAVGNGGAIIHWDGSHWKLSDVAGPVNSLADLRTVAFAGDAGDGTLFAAGMMSSIVQFNADDETWNDRFAGPESNFNGVFVESSVADEVLFVGANGLILEYRTGLFGLVESGVTSVLNAVDGGVVVGDDGVVIFVAGPDSDGVRPVSSIVSSTVEDLVDVFMDDSGWLMAGRDGSILQMDLTMVPHFVAQVSGRVTSVCRTALGVFAAGETGLLVLLPAPDGSTFEDVMTYTQSAIRDLAPLADGSVLAVGDNGIVLRCGDQTCERLYEDPASFLYGVGGISDGQSNDLYAVGWAGAMLGFDGIAVDPVETGSLRVFNDIDGGSGPGGRLYLAGNGGTVAVFDPSLIPLLQGTF